MQAFGSIGVLVHGVSRSGTRRAAVTGHFLMQSSLLELDYVQMCVVARQALRSECGAVKNGQDWSILKIPSGQQKAVALQKLELVATDKNLRPSAKNWSGLQLRHTDVLRSLSNIQS